VGRKGAGAVRFGRLWPGGGHGFRVTQRTSWLCSSFPFPAGFVIVRRAAPAALGHAGLDGRFGEGERFFHIRQADPDRLDLRRQRRGCA
jgi:hypothetical protein